MEAQLNTTTPTGSKEPNPVLHYGCIPALAGPLAAALGVLVLVGWLLGMRTLTSVFPNYATIKPNTAFCFVLAGLSLWLMRLPPGRALSSKSKQSRLGRICALLVALIGLLTLTEYFSNLNLGIDQTLLRDIWTDVRVSPPGRMSIATAFGFFLLGTSLFLVGRKRPSSAIASQILALVSLVGAVLTCAGYVYGVHGLYAVSLYSTMGVHTALVLLLLCVGALFARPDQGLVSVITSNYSGGQMARLILPLTLTGPFFIGWLRLQGERLDLYETEFGLALFATSNIIIFTTLVWISAKSLNTRTAGLEKRVAERSAELAGAKEKLQAVLDAATQVAIIATDKEGLITVFNRGAEQMLGYTADEMVGQQSPAIIHLESEVAARGRELTEEIGQPVQGFDVFVAKARHGQPEQREWTYVRKDGKTLKVNLLVTASYDRSGIIMGFLGVAIDVTARTRVEKTLRDQALILDLANDAIFIRDTEDRIIYWNQGAQRLYAFTKEEAVGQVARTLFSTKFPQPFDNINAQLLATGHWEGELVHTRRDGTLVTVASSWTLQRDDWNQPVSVIEMNYDITVAIIDMQMPEMDGLALVRKINADPLLSATQLILLTPFGKPIPTDELKTTNVAACCVKPVRQSGLYDCLRRVLTHPAKTGAYP